MRFNGAGHLRRKYIAIHRERLTTRHAGDGSGAQQQRVQTPEFFFEKPRCGWMLIALERIAADQLGQAIGLVCVGGSDRAHFVQNHIDPALRQLPRGFGTGQAASGHYDAGLTLHA
jgi:hypothetical protein